MSPRILLVEDQAPLAEAISRLLARHQAEVDVVGDGQIALQQLAKANYDLLITALKIPKLSGVDVIRKVRASAQLAGLPVMIVTGVYKGEEYRKRARESLGVEQYLEKPFTQDDFIKSVRALIDLPEPSEQPAGSEAAAPSHGSSTTERAPARVEAAREEVAKPGKKGHDADHGKPAETAAKHHEPAHVAEIKPRPAVTGDFGKHPLDKLLVEAHHKRATGVLYVEHEGDDRTLLFVNGLPMGLEAKNPSSSFGNYLFCKGHVSLMEFQIYQGQAGNGAGGDDIFVKMGCLSPDDFHSEYRRYLEDSLIEMLGWSQGRFTFQVWPDLPEGTPRPAVNLASVIHRGYLKHVPPERIAPLREAGPSRFPLITKAFYDHRMHMSLAPGEAAILDGVDGSRPLAELLPSDETGREEAFKSVAAFMAMGMIELFDEPKKLGVEPPFPIRSEEERTSLPPSELRPAEPECRAGEEPAPDAGGGIAAIEDHAGGAPAEAESLPEPEPEKEEGFDDLLGDLDESLGDLESLGADAGAGAGAEDAAREQAAEQEKRDEELREFHKGLSGKNYYEIFGMKPSQFNFSKLKEEYFRLTKQFSPENFIASSGDMLSMAEDTLSKLATAYNTLTNVVSKEKYDDMLGSSRKATGIPGSKDHDKMQSEVAFQSGMAFLEMADWAGAEKSLAEAMDYAPENADIVAHYAYAVYNKNRKSVSVRKRVHELLGRSLRLNPKCAPAYAYRGALLLEEEKPSLAEADFNKALSINPRYRFALKGMKKIEQRKQDDKKGIFGRFRR